MKNKILALILILLLTSIYLTTVISVQAVGADDWITDFQIEDAETEQLLMKYNSITNETTTYSPILPGADLKVTFTVNVFTAGSGNLKLTTSLLKSRSDTFWELVSQDYSLGPDYNPTSASAQFNWVEGTFTMILYGKVPASTSDVAKTISVVSIYGPSGGNALDQIKVSAVSAKMDAWQTLYNQKEAKLNSLISSGIHPGYIQLYTNVLNQSESIAGLGYVDSAIALLQGLDVPNEPVSSTMEALFLPIVVVLAVVAVLFVVMFMRARGKVGYYQLVVEDQIKDLEGLTLRASKIDRTLSSNLDSVKDRLKRLVGM